MAAEVRREQPPHQDLIALGEDQIADTVKTERRRLSDLLDDLGEAEWAVRSLCDAWTVREVVAHLTLSTRATFGSVILPAIKARGDLDRMAAMMAHDRAARYTPDELVRQLRESAESSRRMPGSSPMDPLMDLLVHGQDIARPLERHHPVPIELAVPALAYVTASRFHGGSGRVAGLTLVTTDADWWSGLGPQVRGNAEDLLLAVSGRPAGLAGLTGPGAELLAARLGGR
ncbi:maleylpyruvate isomerase family mycothiol-dependent enzyme [Actinomadura madurae]|uniref:maleylpyruvate isomerase family mycothiol-dependent enzyme n=1 Tax=Actinomadura madurae TaxID=1993 RepID=UPI002026BE09|nr:maleylpyruvate isomerase family mycothiol-dependent enzyme [Actinomadura madurae]URM98033.1 maleylpyruvate isomerase family mycothiol-dependent enzyme [Actinomadura madurae]